MPAKKSKAAHYIEVEVENGIDRFHCPVCGKAVLKSEEGLIEKFCQHVLLVHDWVGEFTARDKKIRALIDEAEESADEGDTDAIELLRNSFGPTVAFFEFFEPAGPRKDAQALTIVFDLGECASRD